MASASKAIAEAKRVVADDRYGYHLGGWGSPNGEQAYGVDCRGFVKLCLDAGGYPSGGYTWTGDMKPCMTAAGWTWHSGTNGIDNYPFVVLLHVKKAGESTGHTAFYGGGVLYEAWHDYDGKSGDGGGKEVRSRDYYNYPWDGYLTYASNETIGVPADMSDWIFVQGSSATVYLMTPDGKMHGLKDMNEYNFVKWCIEQAISAQQGGSVLHLRVDSNTNAFSGMYQKGNWFKVLQNILKR